MKAINLKPYTLYLLICIVLTTSLKCKKENLNTLPAATMSGENTIGAYIDGKLFVSRRTDLLSENPKATYYESVPKLLIYATSTNIVDGPYLSITLKESLNQPNLNFVNGGENVVILNMGGGNTDRFQSESGDIKFTRFDINAKIFSGTFDIIFKNETGKTVRITEGRFDLKAK